MFTKVIFFSGTMQSPFPAGQPRLSAVCLLSIRSEDAVQLTSVCSSLCSFLIHGGNLCSVSGCLRDNYITWTFATDERNEQECRIKPPCLELSFCVTDVTGIFYPFMLPHFTLPPPLGQMLMELTLASNSLCRGQQPPKCWNERPAAPPPSPSSFSPSLSPFLFPFSLSFCLSSFSSLCLFHVLKSLELKVWVKAFARNFLPIPQISSFFI